MPTRLLTILAGLILMLLFPLSLYAEGAYYLTSKPISANSAQNAPVVEFTNNGGTITYDVTYNSNCQYTYQLKWEFSKDISRLEEGESFSVKLDCVNCQDVCGYRWNTAMSAVGGANNITSISGVDNYIYNGNFIRLDSSDYVKAWDETTYSQTYDLAVHLYKSAPNSGFYLIIGGHKITYHYVFQESSSSDCKININGLNISGTREVGNPLTFNIEAENSCSSTIYYRYSVHGGYGTNSYDGLNWKMMTSSEYTTDNSIDYTFTEAGQYVVVIWAKNATSDLNTNVKIIGVEVEIDEQGKEPYFPF